LAIEPDDTVGRTPICSSDTLAAPWRLPAHELHVWSASLERPPEAVRRMRAVLSEDELDRADRLRFEPHRSRFVVGRALLRGLLARYVGATPRELVFQYGEFRKPALPGGPCFNLSHSGSVALYAFSGSAEVGIDVELEGRDLAHERVAERFFSPKEVRVLRSLPRSAQARAFLVCWTRKEAFIKARGDGLSLPLDSFDVTLVPYAPAALLRTAWCSGEPARWQMEDLSDRKAGYVAAVALPGDTRVLKRQSVQTIEGSMPGQEQT
jgi:4'-phosphopantetheinyl transferase